MKMLRDVHGPDTFVAPSPSRRRLLAAMAALPTFALAQGRDAYPSRAIRLVVPVPPGGPADLAARAIAERLREELGQPVVVDNRAGAAGTLGTVNVLQAPADGYTLLLSMPSAQITAPLMLEKPPYDGAKDFTAIGQFLRTSAVLLVNKTVSVRDFQGLVSYAKARPGKLNYSSTGIGSNPHLVMELVKLRTGMDIVHVPYKGGAAMLQAAVSNEVQILFGEISTSMPWIQSGRLTPLGIVSDKRSPLLPDVPSLVEDKVLDAPADFWMGLAGPPRMPAGLVRKLNHALAKAVRHPEMQQFFAKTATEPAFTDPESFQVLWQSEQHRWEEVIRARHIRAE
ncbi:Bug family tripartite tricarboxylate transporter substrate binding protein [Variovorax ginsengisoli]|uniref:Tripartite tricarboxylate transporter substrate binding protein n=1 Tax=Variovorax ginsengisoli TaxID=363844 RepID=A0ABT8SGF1_9BURK|nr:tripartite tricarboxylate transporter substrate binding protein [Variovorax ginsengisoli]MDN8618831.1 tripartite tricarboxylate transporter substrate binding protein [Variovorax ginsengisoli]MDO1538001.1 tripartite tricarboxylate transporter substrate binding protein [Variovorax ginsengisoli]